MIPLNIFNDFCSWWVLWWILPFILGALLGWAIYGKWKRLYDEEQVKAVNLGNQVAQQQSEIKALKSNKLNRTTTPGDLKDKLVDYENKERYYKAELRSKNAEIVKLKAQNDKNTSGEIKEEGGVANSHQEDREPHERSSNKGRSDESKVVPIATNQSQPDFGVVEIPLSNLKTTGKDSIENNMQVIEGIGPSMESVLFENGIHNWAELSNYTAMELKEILNKYGSKYAMINAKHWPMQASLAASGNWEKLIAYQKATDTSSSTTKSKAEIFLIKMGLLTEEVSTNTNLQAFVGIDSEVEFLLKKNGVGTWEDLATTPIVKIRGVLGEAGQSYEKINPTSWPKQAQLALAGKTKMLEEYQEFLKSNT